MGKELLTRFSTLYYIHLLMCIMWCIFEILMAPVNKYTKEEIVDVAFKIVEEEGYKALTAKRIASLLNTSTRPIFTAFKTMDELRKIVRVKVKECYDSYINKGLTYKIPFLGVGKAYILFAREKTELYRLLFLSEKSAEYNAVENTAELISKSVMNIYNLSEKEALFYFRSLWLVVHSIATLIVSSSCPYEEKDIDLILTQFSLSTLKAIKEVPSFIDGNFNKDEIFTLLVKK